jgi:hypothetical protein
MVGGLLLMAGLLGWGLVEFSRARDLRCYTLDPARSTSAQLTLKGQSLICMSNRCRVVVRYPPQRGLACYFSSYHMDDTETVFSASEKPRSALQKSSAPPGYRTT